MTTAVVTQPTYLPWLGYFEAMARADVFVVLDVVQFERRSWQQRNRLKGSHGEPFWLTVPVVKAPQQTPLRHIQVAGRDWATTHLRSIETALAGAPHAAVALDLARPVLADPPASLTELNQQLIAAVAEALGVRPRWVQASDLEVGGARSELLTAICAAVGADRYYTAAGSRPYMEDEHDVWDRSGLEVEFQAWAHPEYPQGQAPFVSHLSALDAIAHLGLDGARAAIGAPVEAGATGAQR